MTTIRAPELPVRVLELLVDMSDGPMTFLLDVSMKIVDPRRNRWSSVNFLPEPPPSEREGIALL
jgi:hypothetical protein